MRISRKFIIAAVLLGICIIIHCYSADKARVEQGYSTAFFPQLAGLLRYLLGRIPVSIGDLIYGLAAAWLIWKLLKCIRSIFRKERPGHGKQRFAKGLFKVFIFTCCIYIVFNIFWGINYNRKGIAWQLGLTLEKYNTNELKEINGLLVDKINASKRSLLTSKTVYPSNNNLFIMVDNAYKNISQHYAFLQYKPPSIKSSIWGQLGNYAGFTGYYNPFTGEAQLNTTVPNFLQPYIACHEVAHQLGYAKEMEANFVGYLAASASTDELFHYSVYLDLFVYANRNLYFIDSTASRSYRTTLIPEVVSDLKEWAAFNAKHQNPAEPVIRWIYGKFLQSNQQPQGILSYDEVTAFIIAYYKKFGKI